MEPYPARNRVSHMMSILMLLVVIVGLLLVIGCSYWVLSGSSLEGVVRNKAPNLKECPRCGGPLDSQLDHCPRCSLRISV
jgi:hypothetical protein